MNPWQSVGFPFGVAQPAQAGGRMPHLGLTINSVTTSSGGWNTDQDTGITEDYYMLWLWREAGGDRQLDIAFGPTAVADPPAHFQRVASQGTNAIDDSPVLCFLLDKNRRHFRIQSPAIAIWKWAVEKVHG